MNQILLVLSVLHGESLTSTSAAIVGTTPQSPIHAGVFPDEPAAEIDIDADGILDVIIPGSFSQINAVPQGSNRVLSFDDFGTINAIALADGSFIGVDPGDQRVWGSSEPPPPIMAGCFSGGGVVCFGQFLGGIDYLGVEFDISGNTHYGWLEISSHDRAPIIDVVSWAYETEPGVGILAGAIPEPSVMVSMMVAAALLIGQRRRRS